MENLIRCKDAAFGYDGHIAAEGISFSVRSGDYLCIVGENGSGKSTLVKGILRLIPPLRGSIHFDERIKAGRIGYLSQQMAAKKDFPAGAYEIVLSGCIGALGARPFYSRKEKETALENIDLLGIGDLKNRCFRELSGGQQRRVLIARSLCAMGEKNPRREAEAPERLLVLDEPASGLDPLVSAGLYGLLKKINKEMGITIIMVSHDVRAAEKYANLMLHMRKEGCFFGAVSEYVRSGTAMPHDL
jgi:zinc transport system ATP-binding protein